MAEALIFPSMIRTCTMCGQGKPLDTFAKANKVKRDGRESQFKDGMSWENMEKWHVDHIIPVAAFNFEKPSDQEFLNCWALNNLQPLWASENIAKGNKISSEYERRVIA